MRILDKYIIREFLRTYLIIFLSFVAIFVVIDVIDNLPRLIRNGATAQQATIYYLMRLPYLLVLTSPVTVLLTGLFMMSALSKHNESIAIRAAGISIKRAMLPLFGIGLIISIAVAVMLGYGVYLFKRVDSLKQEIAIQTKINQDNAKELETVKANYAKNTQALENDIKAMQVRNQKTQIILERIRHEKDAPAAAVLTVTLDGLRTPNKN